jgi:hypothetical protein
LCAGGTLVPTRSIGMSKWCDRLFIGMPEFQKGLLPTLNCPRIMSLRSMAGSNFNSLKGQGAFPRSE